MAEKVLHSYLWWRFHADFWQAYTSISPTPITRSKKNRNYLATVVHDFTASTSRQIQKVRVRNSPELDVSKSPIRTHARQLSQTLLKTHHLYSYFQDTRDIYYNHIGRAVSANKISQYRRRSRQLLRLPLILIFRIERTQCLRGHCGFTYCLCNAAGS